MTAVLPPLRGQARLTSERLPPLLSSLLRILWCAGIAILVSGTWWFLLQAASISGHNLGDAATRAIVVPVLWRTHFGHAMLARLVLTVLVLAGLPFAAAARTPHRRIVTLAAIAMLAAADVAALAWAGHAVATPGATHLGADIAHLLAAGLWLGGL